MDVAISKVGKKTNILESNFFTLLFKTYSDALCLTVFSSSMLDGIDLFPKSMTIGQICHTHHWFNHQNAEEIAKDNFCFQDTLGQEYNM